MKFAFMARILDYYGYGIKTNLEGLLGGIAQINCEHEIVLFVDNDQDLPGFIRDTGFKWVPLSPSTNSAVGKFYWDHVAVGAACKRLGIDALYAPAHVRPAYAPCPVVVHVLDMMYHRFPHHWEWSDQAYFRLAVSILTSRASNISALSESTKKDILHFTSAPEDVIEVIYPGVPDGFEVIEPEKTQGIRKQYRLPNPFILFIGSFHPRKGVIDLINAFEEVAGEIPHDLVIVVSTNYQSEFIEQRILHNQVAQRIRLLKGVVPRSELPLFCNEADLFVFPSLYEGFGFPVLEALACGCPTITTNISSLPEVAGNAALLVQPNHAAGLKNAIERVLLDTDFRDNLRQRALQQARRFSWATTAQKTIGLLEKAATMEQENLVPSQ